VEALTKALIEAGRKDEASTAAQASIREVEALKTPSPEIQASLTRLKALLEQARK
jgi:hypothetical protein